jgi:uncharacterized protein YwgA
MLKRNSQPTYKRQRFLLSFISQIQGGVTSTDLQKLVFLYIMDKDLDYYEFVPYKYGSYSFQLAEDVEILCKNGYLSNDSLHIKAIENFTYDTIFPSVTERGNNLIRKVYRSYPYYAINSEILSRLFSIEETERFNHERLQYTKADPVLFTIGYEGKSIEAFINILIKNDVHLLCDVRKNPLSRKFGFSKNKLDHITKQIGIKYIHIPDLGIESGKRNSLNTVEDYQDLFRDYEKTLLEYKHQLEWLFSVFTSNVRIALMCYEKNSEMCHRHIISNYLSNTYEIRSVDL